MMLVVVSRLSLTVAYFGSPKVVKQDIWWETFLGALATAFVHWAVDRIAQRFPTMTLFEAAESVLGKVLGRLITALYVLFFVLMLGLNLRLVGEFFRYAFLPRTPLTVICGVLVLLAVWSAQAGIEVIARASQIVLPLLFGSLLLIAGLLAKDVDLRELLPFNVLVTGPLPHMQDMVYVAARTVEIAWVALLVPFVNHPTKLFPALFKAQLWIGFTWVMMSIVMFGVLGTEIEDHFFPFFAAARLIHVADFLERIDGLFLAVWLFGMFLRVSVLLWAASQGTAHLVGAKQYRPLIWSLAAIAFTYSLAQAQTFGELITLMGPAVMTPLGLIFVLILPMLVLMVAKIRKLRLPPPWEPPAS